MRTLLFIFVLLTIFAFQSCSTGPAFQPEGMEVYRIENIKRAFLKPVNVSVSKNGDTYTLTGKNFPTLTLTIKQATSSDIFKKASWKNGTYEMEAAFDGVSVHANCKKGKGNEKIIEEIANSTLQTVVIFDSLVTIEGELKDIETVKEYYANKAKVLLSSLEEVRRFDSSFKVNLYTWRHTVDNTGKTIFSGHESSFSYSGFDDGNFTRKVKKAFKDVASFSKEDKCTYKAFYSFYN